MFVAIEQVVCWKPTLPEVLQKNKTQFVYFILQQGHLHKLFCFPSPSLSLVKVGRSVGKKEKRKKKQRNEIFTNYT